MNTAFVFQRYYRGRTMGGWIIIGKDREDIERYVSERVMSFKGGVSRLFSNEFKLISSFPTDHPRKIIRIEGYGEIEKLP